MCREVYRAINNTVLISDTFIIFTLTIWIPDSSCIQFRAVKLFFFRSFGTTTWSLFTNRMKGVLSLILILTFPFPHFFTNTSQKLSARTPFWIRNITGFSGSFRLSLSSQLSHRTEDIWKNRTEHGKGNFVFWISGHLCYRWTLSSRLCCCRFGSEDFN